jgi:hypothetical protein
VPGEQFVQVSAPSKYFPAAQLLEPIHVVMPMAVACVPEGQSMQETWFSRDWNLPTAQKTHTFLPGLLAPAAQSMVTDPNCNVFICTIPG